MGKPFLRVCIEKTNLLKNQLANFRQTCSIKSSLHEGNSSMKEIQVCSKKGSDPFQSGA
jgi:hypothetical protein